MSWLPTDWIGRGVCFQQRRVFSLLDIDAAVVQARPVPVIGYRVDHFVETSINLARYFDAISAKAGIWCQDDEVECPTPKALIENKRRAFDAVDHRSIWPPSKGGIGEQTASTSPCKLAWYRNIQCPLRDGRSPPAGRILWRCVHLY